MDPKPAGLFDLDAYLRRQSARIDEALEAYLQRYPGESQTLFRALRYGVFSGGKRIRPILLLAAGEVFGARFKTLLPFACAVELIHAYSLIHDDLPALDSDELRRGIPTAHKVFGEGMALLAGDGLLTEAFRLMVDGKAVDGVAAERVIDVVRELAQAAGAMGLVGGQALDLEAERTRGGLGDRGNDPRSETGALILASVRIGPNVGGAKNGDLARISHYGEFLGLAFQIADDIIDAQGGVVAESGHKERKKATYPSIVGLKLARERLEELLKLCLAELEPFAGRAHPLAAIAGYVVSRATQTTIELPAKEIHG